MEELTSILQKATAGIAPSYFHLNLDGGDPVYRERVYCYELYHQMRMRWPAQTSFYLNGEVDKAGHPKMVELRDRFPKPDLLVHQPGYMTGNFAVIEVKCESASRGGIIKDLETLSFFRQRVRLSTRDLFDLRRRGGGDPGTNPRGGPRDWGSRPDRILGARSASYGCSASLN